MIPNHIFYNRWWVVFASVLGLMVGPSIHVFVFGVFLKPVTEDLGLSRSILSSAFLLSLTLTAITCPLVGVLIDRWGIRKVLLPVIVLFALATAGLSLIPASCALCMYALYAVHGIVAAGQSPASYPKVISAWFDRERGLALGIAMAGVGLGATIMPKLASLLILEYGWRMAYVGLGITVFAVALLPVAIFIREPSARWPAPVSATQFYEPAVQPSLGLSAAQALRGSWRFWALALAFFLAATAINGTLTSLVAMLTDRGEPTAVATSALAAAGLAAILGRVACGYCLDKIFGPYVAIGFFVAPMIGVALLATTGGSEYRSLLGAVLCGSGVGAEVDLMSFLAGRYFGLRAFGKIYGVMFGIFALGTGLGPYLMGLSYDIWGSYDPMLMIFELALAVTCSLFIRLGPYPFPPHETPVSGSRINGVAVRRAE